MAVEVKKAADMTKEEIAQKLAEINANIFQPVDDESKHVAYFKENGIKYDAGEIPWQWEEDGLIVTRSAAWSAPGCHDGCGVQIFTDKKTGRLVKVEGDEDNPFYQGRLCVRCLAMPEVIYHPDRIQFPMKRAYEDRGKDKWTRITWEEAYDTIEEKFNQIKIDYGPESVIFSTGTGRGVHVYMARLAYSFGSPNYAYFQTGASCYAPRISASNVLMGTYTCPDTAQYFIDRYDNPKWVAPKVIFVWGNNPLISNADGNMGHWIVDCMRRGSKLVVVDPRLTWLAAKADLWLQIRPGTDAALAMAMGDYIVKNDLYDHEFVDSWCYGFDEYAERVSSMPVEKAAHITWIAEEKIRRAADYMAMKPVSVQWGLALDQQLECVNGSQSVVALWSITGNIDNPGGNIPIHQPFNIQSYQSPDPFEILTEEQCKKRIGGEEYPMFKYSGCVLSHPELTTDAMVSDYPYPVKANWIQGGNALACTSQQPEKRILQSYLRGEFNVGIDLFMTPTLMATCDIVLPCATFPERDGIRALYYYVQTTNKCVDKAVDCKSDMEICFELGSRFNKAMWPGETLDDFFTWSMKETEMTFDEVRSKNWVYPDYEYEKYRQGKQRVDGNLGFNTPTGRIELYSTLLQQWGMDPLPTFEEPEDSPVSRPDLMKEYPLILTTGARHWAYFHSEQRQIPHLRALRPDPIVEMHPKTAEELGIADKEWVMVENRYGKAKMRVELSIGIDPRVVNCDHAWWFPEKDPEELFGVFESNINQLIPAHFGSSGFGSNAKSSICRVVKIEKGA